MDFNNGVLLGGRLCRIKYRTGLFLLLPILLSWIVIFHHWLQHLKEGKTTMRTFLFGTTMTYPIFCKLKNFIVNYKKPQELAYQKDKAEQEMGWVEGIFESLPQVNASNNVLL